MIKRMKLVHKIVNYFYLSLSKVADKIPFSGSYWVELVAQGVGTSILNEYGAKFHPNSEKPIDICQAYLDLLDAEEYINATDIVLVEEQNVIKVFLQRENCIYQDYCLRAREQDIYFSCPRLSAFQAVLKQTIRADYDAKVDIDLRNQQCVGYLTIARSVHQEIVAKEGNTLQIAGERAILMPIEAYASMLAAIAEHAPHTLKHVLYDAGYRAGTVIAGKAKELYENPKTCLQELLDVLSRSGLGKMELLSLDPDGKQAVIRCYDSYEVDSSRYYSLYRTPRVTCDLIRGRIAAYLTVLFDRNMMCEEMQCKVLTGDWCEFIVLEIPAESR